MFRVILFHFTRFVLTFAMTLKSANYKNHWNTLVFYNQWKIMSDLIYVPWANAWFWFNSIVWFTLVIKVKIEILKIKNSLIFSNLGSCCQIKICPGVFFFFFLISIFWHYYRNSFEFKKSLLILRYIEILSWKSCIWRAINGCCPRNNKLELTFLVINGKRHWLAISNLFLKKH